MVIFLILYEISSFRTKTKKVRQPKLSAPKNTQLQLSPNNSVSTTISMKNMSNVFLPKDKNTYLCCGKHYSELFGTLTIPQKSE